MRRIGLGRGTIGMPSTGYMKRDSFIIPEAIRVSVQSVNYFIVWRNRMNAAQMLPDLKSISCGGEFLSDFVENCFDASHVRDAQTRKHLVANYRQAVSNGMKSMDDLIGVTPREIYIDDVLHRKEKLNLDSAIISSEHNNLARMEKYENRCWQRKALSILRVSTYLLMA